MGGRNKKKKKRREGRRKKKRRQKRQGKRKKKSGGKGKKQQKKPKKRGSPKLSTTLVFCSFAREGTWSNTTTTSCFLACSPIRVRCPSSRALSAWPQILQSSSSPWP